MRTKLRRRFRLLVLAQALLLLATLSVLAWSLLETRYIALPLLIGLVVLAEVVALIHYVESHVDTLEEFFAAVNYEDFTRHFISGDVDAELRGAFNRVIERFRDARADRDVQASYLEAVVRHIPVPLLAVRASGALRLVNNPARRLTALPALGHLDELAALDPDLPAQMRAIEPGQQRLLQARIRDVPVELRIAASEIRIGGEIERLYSIENLSGELRARESSAWRNLIRVLTHEIMNTLTPISSLAQTSAGLLENRAGEEDVREAVETIARRSDGLMNFVSRYRELMKVPRPATGDVPVGEAVQRNLLLLAEPLAGVAVDIDIQPQNLEVHADPALLDQLLLNILKNAAEATANEDQPTIRIGAGLEFGHVVLRVADNGPGVPPESLDQLFIPFYTTKRDGSGIGLSLSRQIMTAHGGEIGLQRVAGETIVSLVF